MRTASDILLLRAALMACLVLGACGCKVKSELFCARHPDDPRCPAIGADASLSICTDSEQCMSPEVCDLDGTKTCVQCTTAEPAACPGTTPACVNTQCTACTSHAQCATNACLPDGSCAEESRIAYVDPSGTDNSSCTRMMPCTKISKALATTRAYVKLTGTTNEQVSLNNRNVTFLAGPGARLSDTSIGILMKIDGSSQVEIYDLEISNALGTGNPGISMQLGNTATLKVVRSRVSSNAGAGISSSGGTLTVQQSTVSGNGDTGITMSAAGVVVLTNNFIHHNGNTLTASAGGLLLRPTGASKVEFNTVIDNQANLGVASAGGVFCDSAGFVGAHNIIFRNTGGQTTLVQTIGICGYGDSYNIAGANGADNTPQFKSPNAQPLDYHLTATSPASILGAAGACTGTDYDGDSRPQGGACDLGADELRP